MTDITRRRALKRAAAALGAVIPALAFTAAANSRKELTFEIYKDSRDRFRWRLKSPNGQVVATAGGSYSAKSSCRDGIDLVMRGASRASIEDLT